MQGHADAYAFWYMRARRYTAKRRLTTCTSGVLAVDFREVACIIFRGGRRRCQGSRGLGEADARWGNPFKSAPRGPGPACTCAPHRTASHRTAPRPGTVQIVPCRVASRARTLAIYAHTHTLMHMLMHMCTHCMYT